MLSSTIKIFFENSQYYENYHNIDHVILKFQNIKNLKKKYKKELFLFIHDFIKYDVKMEYLEEYVLYLIDKFGLLYFEKELNQIGDIIYDKLYDLNSIKLLLNKNINDEKFIYENCTPYFFLKNNHLDKKKLLTNKKMIEFFNKLDICNNILNEKIKIGENIKKYVKYSTNIDIDFINSIKNGNFKNIRTLIKYGADVNRLDGSALIYSSMFGHIQTVKFLFKHGANVHSQNDLSLKIASQNSHTEVVKCLIESGANVNIDNEYPLVLACRYGHIDIVKYLYENGANIHINDDILIIPCYNGRLEVVKFLIEKGITIHSNGEIPFKVSCQNGHIDIVKFLIKKGSNIIDDNNLALMLACKNGHIDVVKFLIKKGADIHDRDDDAIKLASKNKHINIVKYLIEFDIDYYCNKNFVKYILAEHKLVEYYEKFGVGIIHKFFNFGN